MTDENHIIDEAEGVDDSDEPVPTSKITVPRRQFLQAVVASTGAGLLGTSAVGTAAGEPFDVQFASRRVREARKAWVKGFRGRPDRTLGVLSDSLESRHPDIGPWNGVRAVPDGDDGLTLIHENLEVMADVPDDIRFFAEGRPIPERTGDRHEYPFTAPTGVDRMIAHSKGPAAQSNGLKLLLETASGTVITSNGETESPHAGIAASIEPGRDYVLAIENTMRSIRGDYFLEALYYTDNPNGETDPFASVDPDDITADTPKVLGWYNEDYNTSNPHPQPWSGPHQGGHGQYLASIMAGSGRGCTVDERTVTRDRPDTVLANNEHLVYEVDADPGRGVFGVAYGDRVEVLIYGPDGTRISNDDGSSKNRTHSIDSHVTTHETGTKTYEVHVRPRGEGSEPAEAPTRVRRVCAGAFKAPDSTAGDRTAEDHSLWAGVAPNAGLVGFSGWRKTRTDLQEYADDFARLLNLRAITISLGFGNDVGTAGGNLPDGSIATYKALAEAGILAVCRSPSQQPPALRDRAPSAADESISVANAGPWDGIAKRNGTQAVAVDEDEVGAYRKPDVTAPGPRVGNDVHDYIVGAVNADGWRTEEEQDPIRKYWPWANVTSQPPFVAGTAGLVAQALEAEGPPGIALPPPVDAGFEDTMRLKQTILATATETLFTAGPWHERRPTYDFGGHDPVEGWGRVNVDTAVEAASRNLTPPSARDNGGGNRGNARSSAAGTNGRGRSGPSSKTTVIDDVGLDIPRDSRAVAGHVAGEPGVYEVSVDFSHYTGDDQTIVAGPPHLDVYVYDAENPGPHGTPNIVAKSQGVTGSTSVAFSAGDPGFRKATGGTYYVVIKLINIPGAFNSFDIRAQFSLSVKHRSDD